MSGFDIHKFLPSDLAAVADSPMERELWDKASAFLKLTVFNSYGNDDSSEKALSILKEVAQGNEDFRSKFYLKLASQFPQEDRNKYVRESGQNNLLTAIADQCLSSSQSREAMGLAQGALRTPAVYAHEIYYQAFYFVYRRPEKLKEVIREINAKPAGFKDQVEYCLRQLMEEREKASLNFNSQRPLSEHTLLQKLLEEKIDSDFYRESLVLFREGKEVDLIQKKASTFQRVGAYVGASVDDFLDFTGDHPTLSLGALPVTVSALPEAMVAKLMLAYGAGELVYLDHNINKINSTPQGSPERIEAEKNTGGGIFRLATLVFSKFVGKTFFKNSPTPVMEEAPEIISFPKSPRLGVVGSTDSSAPLMRGASVYNGGSAAPVMEMALPELEVPLVTPAVPEAPFNYFAARQAQVAASQAMANQAAHTLNIPFLDLSGLSPVKERDLPVVSEPDFWEFLERYLESIKSQPPARDPHTGEPLQGIALINFIYQQYVMDFYGSQKGQNESRMQLGNGSKVSGASTRPSLEEILEEETYEGLREGLLASDLSERMRILEEVEALVVQLEELGTLKLPQLQSLRESMNLVASLPPPESVKTQARAANLTDLVKNQLTQSISALAHGIQVGKIRGENLIQNLSDMAVAYDNLPPLNWKDIILAHLDDADMAIVDSRVAESLNQAQKALQKISEALDRAIALGPNPVLEKAKKDYEKLLEIYHRMLEAPPRSITLGVREASQNALLANPQERAAALEELKSALATFREKLAIYDGGPLTKKNQDLLAHYENLFHALSNLPSSFSYLEENVIELTNRVPTSEAEKLTLLRQSMYCLKDLREALSQTLGDKGNLSVEAMYVRLRLLWSLCSSLESHVRNALNYPVISTNISSYLLEVNEALSEVISVLDNLVRGLATQKETKETAESTLARTLSPSGRSRNLENVLEERSLPLGEGMVIVPPENFNLAAWFAMGLERRDLDTSRLDSPEKAVFVGEAKAAQKSSAPLASSDGFDEFSFGDDELAEIGGADVEAPDVALDPADPITQFILESLGWRLVSSPQPTLYLSPLSPSEEEELPDPFSTEGDDLFTPEEKDALVRAGNELLLAALDPTQIFMMDRSQTTPLTPTQPETPLERAMRAFLTSVDSAPPRHR